MSKSPTSRSHISLSHSLTRRHLLPMSEPKIAATTPCKVVLEAGKTYYYCTCGHSANQPWCDGSHKGTGFAPKPFTAEKDGNAFLCQCKHSGNAPFCDGSHSSL